MILSARLERLDAFQKSIGLRFNNPSLLESALTHRSFSNEASSKDSTQHNERLEFLGDAALGHAVAAILYARIKEGSEGELSRLKSIAVSERALTEIAVDLGIADMLKLGKGEELSGGRSKKAILADAVEALIGAISLDSGLEKTFEFVERLFGPHIEALLSGFRKDFKTILQEYAQKQFRTLPEYGIVGSDGPEHLRRFWVECRLHNETYGPSVGATKKEAEIKVAEVACRTIAAADPVSAEILAQVAGKPIDSL
jgi:ribonuclease-3